MTIYRVLGGECAVAAARAAVIVMGDGAWVADRDYGGSGRRGQLVNARKVTDERTAEHQEDTNDDADQRAEDA